MLWFVGMKSSVQKAQVRHAEEMYPVVVQEDASGGYWVSCPSFEGCYSQGKTLDEALHNVKEAIALCQEEAPKMRRRQKQPHVSLHLVRV